MKPHRSLLGTISRQLWLVAVVQFVVDMRVLCPTSMWRWHCRVAYRILWKPLDKRQTQISKERQAETNWSPLVRWYIFAKDVPVQKNPSSNSSPIGKCSTLNGWGICIYVQRWHFTFCAIFDYNKYHLQMSHGSQHKRKEHWGSHDNITIHDTRKVECVWKIGMKR